MIQLKRSVMKTDDASVQVISCEVLESLFWHEDFQRNETVWGVQIHFSDGQISTIPDLCTKRADAERFIQRLDGEMICANVIPELVEDYLGELYGLQ